MTCWTAGKNFFMEESGSGHVFSSCEDKSAASAKSEKGRAKIYIKIMPFRSSNFVQKVMKSHSMPESNPRVKVQSLRECEQHLCHSVDFSFRADQ